MKPGVVDACFQTAAVARSDAAHAWQPVTVGVRIGLGRAQVGMHRAGNGIVDGEHEQAFARGKLEKLGLPAIDFQRAFQGVLEQQAGVGVIVAESNAEHVITFLTNICLYFIIGGQRRETKVDSKTTVLDNRRWVCAKNDKKTTAFDSAVGSQ